MAGSLAATDAWFANPASQVSAHFGVGLNGETHRYVRPEDRAWANGIRETGNNWDRRALPNVNPNELTVSIETEDLGSAAQAVSDAQYTSVRAIAQLLVAQYPSIRYLLRHTDISPLSRANCPGNRWLGSGRFQTLARELGLATFL